MTFVGSDNELEKLDRVIANYAADEAKINYAEKTGFFPDNIEVEAQKQKILTSLKRDRNRYLEIPDSFYDNAKYFVDIITTGEQIDTGQRNQVLQFAMQALATNPTILQNPATRILFFKFLELAKISPIDLNIDLESLSGPQLPVAGSLASPGASPQPVAGIVNRQI